MEQLQSSVTILEQIIIGAIISIACGYAIVYAKKGVSYLKSKDSLIKDDKLRKIFDDTLDRVDDLISINIISAENTLKPIILDDIAKGKVSKDELKSLAIIVKDNVIKQLGDNSVQVLNNSIGDLNSYLENRIEEVLAELKLDPSVPVSKTVLPEVITPVIDTTALENENAQLKADKENLSQQNVDLKSSVESLTQNVSDLSSQLEQAKSANVELQNKVSQIASAIQL
jgi:hypothetical protein